MTVKINYLFWLLFFAISIPVCSQAMELDQKKIMLLTSDKQTLALARSDAEKSITINNLLQECQGALIPLDYAACTKSTLETIFSLVNQPQAAITANLTKCSFEAIAQIWEAVNYLDIAALQSSCLTAAINLLTNENDHEQFKKLLEQQKLLHVDLKKLLKKGLVDKYLIALYKRFKSACNVLKFGNTSKIDIITAAAISPNGQFALIATFQPVVHLIDLATGETIRELKGHSLMVCSIAFSPNANTALTGSEDDTARLWNLDTGETIRVFKGNSQTFTAMVISHDGKYALTGGSPDKTACLWHIQTGELLKTLSGHTGAIKAVAFSHDDKQALTGSDDKTARLWDLETDQSIKVLEGHLKVVTSVALHPVRYYALTGSNDNMAHLWDLYTGKLIKSFKHDSLVTAVQFIPNGAYALTGAKDRNARLWSLEGDEMTEIYKADFGINSLAYSTDGAHALIADTKGYYVPLIPRELLASLERLLIAIQAEGKPSLLQESYFKDFFADYKKIVECLPVPLKATPKPGQTRQKNRR